MTAEEMDVQECEHEALVFIKINAHPKYANGDLSEYISHTQQVITGKLYGKNRQEIVEKINDYLETKVKCL